MGISFYGYVVHLWSEKRQKRFRPSGGRRRGLRRGEGDTQAKHINVEKTRFARFGVDVGRFEAGRQPSSLVDADTRRPGPSRTRQNPPVPAAPLPRAETPAETRGSGLAASAGRAARGRSGGGGFLRISRAGGKPL